MRGIKIPQQYFGLKMQGGLMREGGCICGTLRYFIKTVLMQCTINQKCMRGEKKRPVVSGYQAFFFSLHVAWVQGQLNCILQQLLTTFCYNNALLHGMYILCSAQGTSPLNYPFWAAAVIGPFVYILAVAHAALWKQISSIVGSVVSFTDLWQRDFALQTTYQ